MRTKIIYEDAHVLVCHKPAGLATQSGRVGQQDVVSELKNYLAKQESRKSGAVGEKNVVAGGKKGVAGKGQKEPYLGIVHRLDQPVEGLLVFAKTGQAAAHLTKQLAENSLNKQYYAMVCGKPRASKGELVDYLVKDGNTARVEEGLVGNKTAAAENSVENRTTAAKKAVLQYSVIEEKKSEDGRDYSVLDIHIETGRFHQIRVQMAHAGLPLLGDNKYGTQEALELGRTLGLRNVALYAYQLEFKHPVNGRHMKYVLEPEMYLCNR